MGTMALSETFCLDKLQAFFNVFKDLPYLILWKANGQQMPKDLNVPANIHFEQWLPQKDILCKCCNFSGVAVEELVNLRSASMHQTIKHRKTTMAINW